MSIEKKIIKSEYYQNSVEKERKDIEDKLYDKKNKIEDGNKFTLFYGSDSLFERNCFVATAIYGDINAPQIKILRNFRDNKLLKSRSGRTVVNLYYSGLGEKTSNFIKKYVPFIIPMIRRGLDGLVKKYSQNN